MSKYNIEYPSYVALINVILVGADDIALSDRLLNTQEGGMWIDIEFINSSAYIQCRELSQDI